MTVYFVGIGGIGMSALARYYNQKGARVYGYDKYKSDLTQELEKEGMEIHYQADVSAMPDTIDLAVYTPAVSDDFEELVELRRRGVELVKRAKALGIISRSHQTLAVAGTHGKTTTSTIAAYLMREQFENTAAFFGGISANYGSNYLAGENGWLVVEADEFDRSFLHLNPNVTIITYTEPDHLDIYGDKETFEQAFSDFIANTRPGGFIITKPEIAKRYETDLLPFNVLTYSIDASQNTDYAATNIRVESGRFVFDLKTPQKVYKSISVDLVGAHNIENAVAAIAATSVAGANMDESVKLVGSFKGIERRFEKLGKWNDAIIISDYAHHPTEVKAAINAVHQLYSGYKITCIFQPHLFSRTKEFAGEFAAVLSDCQEVVLLEIYPAREKPIIGISSSNIFSNISIKNKYLSHTFTVKPLLENLNSDVFLFLGAGNIDEIARNLVKA